MTPHIQSWRVGRTWSRFHFFSNAKAMTALCGQALPSPCALTSLTERSAMLSLNDLCRKCLMVYAMYGDGTPIKEPAA